MILNLFAGPGGTEEGLRLLGYDGKHVGVEWDQDAAATAQAAGHPRIVTDVTELDPEEIPPVWGLMAEPPCQTFSQGGKKEGQDTLEDLACAVSLVAAGIALDAVIGELQLGDGDLRSNLVLQPMRFIRALRPEWIFFEEVPPVLPVWEAYADTLRRHGYLTWTGILNSADYGLSQKRRRAFLLASQKRRPVPPPPTHTDNDEWALFDQRDPWVTMADTLEWGPEECRAANRRAPEPAWDDQACLWPLNRPATTIVRSFRPDVIAAPGYRTIGDPSRQNMPGSVAVTHEEMCKLQGIRSDYPFQGNTGKKLSLTGAILPPPWAAAILRQFVGGR